MAKSRQVSARITGMPVIGMVFLAAVFVAGLFLVAFDQGHVLSLAYGEQAFGDLLIHEFTHDVRHAAGFPCH